MAQVVGLMIGGIFGIFVCTLLPRAMAMNVLELTMLGGFSLIIAASILSHRRGQHRADREHDFLT